MKINQVTLSENLELYDEDTKTYHVCWIFLAFVNLLPEMDYRIPLPLTLFFLEPPFPVIYNMVYVLQTSLYESFMYPWILTERMLNYILQMKCIRFLRFQFAQFITSKQFHISEGWKGAHSTLRSRTLTLSMWQVILRYYSHLDSLPDFFFTLFPTRKYTFRPKMRSCFMPIKVQILY